MRFARVMNDVRWETVGPESIATNWYLCYSQLYTASSHFITVLCSRIYVIILTQSCHCGSVQHGTEKNL